MVGGTTRGDGVFVEVGVGISVGVGVGVWVGVGVCGSGVGVVATTRVLVGGIGVGVQVGGNSRMGVRVLVAGSRVETSGGETGVDGAYLVEPPEPSHTRTTISKHAQTKKPRTPRIMTSVKVIPRYFRSLPGSAPVIWLPCQQSASATPHN